MANKRIYFDNSSAAPPTEGVLKAMMPYFTTHWGCLSGTHQVGSALYPEVERAYRSLYAILGADDEDTLVVTSSGAEAVNHVISGVFDDAPPDRNLVAVGSLDESAAFMAAAKAEKRGYRVQVIPVNSEGVITVEAVKEALLPGALLLTLSWADGLIGVINPVEEIAAVCRQRGVLFHLDITHAIGKLNCNVETLGADFVTFNGSQFHAPLGVGALLIRKGRHLSPLIVGGYEQGKMRAGEVNVPLLMGLGQAAEEASRHCDFLCTQVALSRDALEDGIRNAVPGARVFFSDKERLPNISAISFPGCVGEALSFHADRAGLSLSLGGCGFQQLKEILRACGVDAMTARGAVSFSLARTNTPEEVERSIEIVKKSVEQLRLASKGLLS